MQFTKTELKKILKTQYDQGIMDTLVKILDVPNEGSERVNELLDNIWTVIDDFRKNNPDIKFPPMPKKCKRSSELC